MTFPHSVRRLPNLPSVSFATLTGDATYGSSEGFSGEEVRLVDQGTSMSVGSEKEKGWG